MSVRVEGEKCGSAPLQYYKKSKEVIPIPTE